MTAHKQTWLDALHHASRQLREAGIEAPLRDARLLLSEVLGADSARLILMETDPVSEAELDRFSEMVTRRAAGEPVSRIKGRREFYGREFQVGPGVLDPRPDTEVLVDACLARLPRGGRLLDLGAGSGCILLSVLAERSDASGVGIDISETALAIAQTNAQDICPGERVAFYLADWTRRDWTDCVSGSAFDIVVSNPPYIPSADIADLGRDVRSFDPLLALDGGRDGLDAYRRIVSAAPGLVCPGGWLIFEVGIGQAGDVTALVAAAGFSDLGALRDLTGRRRAVIGRRPESRG
ncbi:MAG: peptide chain release factor N(5)-glutamine methyltransferase [Alphaproteobacteria bacterium]|nr:peptide chain release factor N(5)-glutamine methyltransferase [Alphaproteobacteria bacterium]